MAGIPLPQQKATYAAKIAYNLGVNSAELTQGVPSNATLSRFKSYIDFQAGKLGRKLEGLGMQREQVGLGREKEGRRIAEEGRRQQYAPPINDPHGNDEMYQKMYSNLRSGVGATEQQAGDYAGRKMEDVRKYLATGKGGEDESTQKYLQWLGPLGGTPYKNSFQFAEAGLGSIDGVRDRAGFGALNAPKLNLELCGPTDFYRGPKTLNSFFSWQQPTQALSRRCGKEFPLNDFTFENSGQRAPMIGRPMETEQSMNELSQRQQAYINKIKSSTAGGGAERMLNGVALEGLGINYKPFAGNM
ncbi:MAG: hypothetical protein ACT6FC_05030 [Methanosarcinaceae archaeon]